MKNCKFCIFVSAICLAGCGRQTNNIQEPLRTPKSEVNHAENRIIIEVHTHLIQLPDIIKAVFEELDITLEQEDRQPGRYIFTGKSPAGIEVTIEAVSITKGNSLLRISTEGEDDDTEPLLKAIDKALNNAFNKKNGNVQFSGVNNVI